MPDPKDVLVELQKVSYAYLKNNRSVVRDLQTCNRYVVCDLQAQVGKGQFIAVIGPNGSGKSTIARLMAGLLKPTSGRVLVDGLDTAEASNRQEIRKRVGLVLQNPENQLVASIVEEDVAFGPENLCLPADQVRYRVDAALAAVGLSAMGKRLSHTLSGGEQQRLAMAGVLALQPQCLVLDEPTSMLDPLGRQEVVRVLRRLAKDGIGVILITHHMDEAAVADRIWVLGHGSVLIDAPPEKVFSQAELLHELGLALPEVVDLARQMTDYGLELPAGICTMDDMVEYLCPRLK